MMPTAANRPTQNPSCQPAIAASTRKIARNPVPANGANGTYSTAHTAMAAISSRGTRCDLARGPPSPLSAVLPDSPVVTPRCSIPTQLAPATTWPVAASSVPRLVRGEHLLRGERRLVLLPDGI